MIYRSLAIFLHDPNQFAIRTLLFVHTTPNNYLKDPRNFLQQVVKFSTGPQ